MRVVVMYGAAELAVESGRLDVSTMVSEHITLDDLGEVLTPASGDAIRHVVR